jgi:fumarate hydratase class II
MNMKSREEKDSMGTVLVPKEAYYGAQTQRAVENFDISSLRFPSSFIRALGLIKKHAARVNCELQLIDSELADAIIKAAEEVTLGKLDDQFVIDVFQTGSGTSTNMNANEVIAGRANEILAGKKGGKNPVHPNDHVNLGQSSNDVIPSAIHMAALATIRDRLIPAMHKLHKSLSGKAKAFAHVRKIGRTHLQDAVPMSLGQEFSGYARQVEWGIGRIHGTEEALSELTLGGTAVGTGLNTHSDFAPRVIAFISEETGCPFKKALNHFEAQAAQDGAVQTSGALKTFAVSLIKIANDIRWLSSGPRCGLGEIDIPSLHATITFSGQGGNFELNTMLPVIAYNLLQSIHLLSSATTVLAEKCVDGITANKERSASNLEQSLALATGLVPVIGYDKAAAIAKEAYEKKMTVREVALEKQVLPEDELNRLLDEMIQGGK